MLEKYWYHNDTVMYREEKKYVQFWLHLGSSFGRSVNQAISTAASNRILLTFIRCQYLSQHVAASYMYYTIST